MGIGLMTYSGKVKKYKFVESVWRDRIVSKFMSLDRNHKSKNYRFRSSSEYSSYLIFDFFKSVALFLITFISYLLIPVTMSYGETLEGFNSAELYTVKINTRIKYPFFEDSRLSRSGAGFLVDRKRGWIVTNAHVSTRNPLKTSIKFKNQKKFDAQLIYVDPYLDLAIIKIPLKNIPPKVVEANLSCEFTAKVGHPVGAFGHPFSLSFTGTRGIVSGYNLKNGRRMIQTDAPINKGNSGGALIDLSSGSVIGINTSGYSKKDTEGIGFALPIKFVCRILDLLRQGVDPSPAKLYVELSNDPDEDTGLNVVKTYNSNWPLKVGDKIIRTKSMENTEKFETLNDFIFSMRTNFSHNEVVIESKGVEKIVSLKVEKLPKILERKGLFISGINIGPLKERDHSIEPYSENLAIYDVKRSSEASSSGFRSFDRVISVDGKSIKNLKELEKYARNTMKKENASIRFLIYRQKGSYRTNSQYKLIDLKLEEIKLIQYKK